MLRWPAGTANMFHVAQSRPDHGYHLISTSVEFEATRRHYARDGVQLSEFTFNYRPGSKDLFR